MTSPAGMKIPAAKGRHEVHRAEGLFLVIPFHFISTNTLNRIPSVCVCHRDAAQTASCHVETFCAGLQCFCYQQKQVVLASVVVVCCAFTLVSCGNVQRPCTFYFLGEVRQVGRDTVGVLP